MADHAAQIWAMEVWVAHMPEPLMLAYRSQENAAAALVELEHHHPAAWVSLCDEFDKRIVVRAESIVAIQISLQVLADLFASASWLQAEDQADAAERAADGIGRPKGRA